MLTAEIRFIYSLIITAYMRFYATTAYRRAALVLPLALCFSGAFAQQRIPTGQSIRLSPEDADRGLNGVQKNFFFATDTSSDYHNAGFFGQKLRPYLADNPEALDYLNAYRRQKTMLLVERLVFVSAAGLYGQQILAGDERQYFNNTQKVAASVAVISLISNVFITRHTNAHLQRAVETYNSMLTNRHSYWQRLRPTTVGLAATSTGQPLVALRWEFR